MCERSNLYGIICNIWEFEIGKRRFELKLYYIDKVETNLCKAEIEERLREIILEDKFFNIFVGDKKLHSAKLGENIDSFSFISNRKVDMLSPRIHMTVLEKEEGCICNLYYSRTWEIWSMFIVWSFLIGAGIYGYASESNVFGLICVIAAYFLGIWAAKKHVLSICKKVLNILESALIFNENTGI